MPLNCLHFPFPYPINRVGKIPEVIGISLCQLLVFFSLVSIYFIDSVIKPLEMEGKYSLCDGEMANIEEMEAA